MKQPFFGARHALLSVAGKGEKVMGKKQPKKKKTTEETNSSVKSESEIKTNAGGSAIRRTFSRK
jgi:hypothetical protein